MAMDVKAGDYILTTPFTYIATAEVISLLGAIPDFVDIDSKTFNIDLNQIEEKLKRNPDKYKVLIPVDIFGLLADYDKLEELKNKYNFKIIEDGAQSFGASYNGKMSCSFGDIACTSFFPAKPLGCYGDGGAIFTNDEKYARNPINHTFEIPEGCNWNDLRKVTKDVGNKVKKMVVDHLGVDESKVTEEASFMDDLGADSLDTVELVMAFEEEFGSEISDSEAEKILTVGDAIKFIEGKST